MEETNSNQQKTQQPTIVSASDTKSSISQTKQQYASRLFSGRVNRQNYLIGSTLFALIPLICLVIITLNGLLPPSALTMPSLDPNNPSQLQNLTNPSLTTLVVTPTNAIIAIIGILFFIISIPYLFSLQIRRLHDLNLSGWYLLLNFVPMVSYLFSLYVSVWPGTNGDNKYGAITPARTHLMSDILLLK